MYYRKDQNIYLSLDEVSKITYQASLCRLWGHWRRGQVWLQKLFSLLGIKGKLFIFRGVAIDTGLFGRDHYG